MSESQTTCEATKLVIIFPSKKPRRFLEQRWNQKGRHMGREESHQHLNPLICNLAAVYCEKPTVQVNEKNGSLMKSLFAFSSQFCPLRLWSGQWAFIDEGQLRQAT